MTKHKVERIPLRDPDDMDASILRCEAYTFGGRTQCLSHAFIRIDGKPYCRQHGGAKALRIMIEESSP